MAELRAVQPHGPYHLFGWSFGGIVVQEMAVQLHESGEKVALLTILDAFPLAPLDDLDGADRDTVIRALLSNMGVGQEALDGNGPAEAVSVRDQFLASGSPLGALEPATIDAMVDNFAGQARLMRTYTPRMFHGPVLFFTATEGRPHDAFGLSLWDPYSTDPSRTTTWRGQFRGVERTPLNTARDRISPWARSGPGQAGSPIHICSLQRTGAAFPEAGVERRCH